MEPHALQRTKAVAEKLPEEGGSSNINLIINATSTLLSDESNVEEQVISSCVEEMSQLYLGVVNEEEDSSSEFLKLPLVREPIAHLRKKLLVLDINGLLVDIVSPPPKGRKADLNIARRAIFKRPHCMEFLKFCFDNFEVGVWSSRKMENLERVTDYLMEDLKQKLLFSWDLSHCTATSFKTLENKYKPLVFKELRRLWEKHDPNLPWEKEDYSETNTLLLDDSPYKALLNPLHTAIFPYSYSFEDRSDNSLAAGGDLREYLEGLVMAESVQEYVEKHPFGQAALDEKSESWEFYLRVIRSTSFSPIRR
ncbi:NLI interacting factor-like phosphatase [Quillaja saponaria]|uniref:Mitochondrial import inner membrane translocase subunit TIM50 n=1 Tax=Quillaja saponaria TaxID=32244 RepID=A0AAD7PXR5_QUISA|nr:NLI interacting factor-like phosphatase [Quillaja saponaria]KAJ7971083.1 NLI interacting factor-like phosphatase [Quillaja saponaria]